MHEPTRVKHEKVERVRAQNRHISRLIRWTYAYAGMLRNPPKEAFRNEKHTLLKLTRDATFMLLCMTFFVDIDNSVELPKIPDLPDDIFSEEALDPQLTLFSDALWHAVSNRDILNINYTHIKQLVEEMLEKHTIYRCDNQIHGDDLSVTSKDPEIEANQALAVFNLAETICAIEEYAAVDVIHVIRRSTAKNMKLKWIDVTGFVDQRKFLVRYFQINEDNHETTWVQEWWTF